AEEERHVERLEDDEHRRRGAVGQRHHRDQDDEAALGERPVRPDLGVHVERAVHPGGKIGPETALAKGADAAILRPPWPSPRRQTGRRPPRSASSPPNRRASPRSSTVSRRWRAIRAPNWTTRARSPWWWRSRSRPRPPTSR